MDSASTAANKDFVLIALFQENEKEVFDFWEEFHPHIEELHHGWTYFRTHEQHILGHFSANLEMLEPHLRRRSSIRFMTSQPS